MTAVSSTGRFSEKVADSLIQDRLQICQLASCREGEDVTHSKRSRWRDFSQEDWRSRIDETFAAETFLNAGDWPLNRPSNRTFGKFPLDRWREFDPAGVLVVAMPFIRMFELECNSEGLPGSTDLTSETRVAVEATGAASSQIGKRRNRKRKGSRILAGSLIGWVKSDTKAVSSK